MLKLLAIAGLLFYAYAFIRILKTWWSRNWINKTIWFVALSLLGASCIAILLVR